MASTYEPIATTTLGSSATSYTFSSIPSTYTDLVVVVVGTNPTGDTGLGLEFNGDTATNYSMTLLYGTGSSAASARGTSASTIDIGRMDSTVSTNIFHIMNYANTTTNKTVLARGNDAALVTATVGLWRSTAAINAVKIYGSASKTASFNTGTTFTLYGIKAA